MSEISRLTAPVHSRAMFGEFDSEGGESEYKSVMRVVFVFSDGDGRISQESLLAFPDLAAKTIEGQSTPALPAPED